MKRFLSLIALAFAASLSFAQTGAGGRATTNKWGIAPSAAKSAIAPTAAKPAARASEIFTVPYLNTFETEKEQRQVTFIDANHDNYTFMITEEYNEDGTRYGYAARYSFNYKSAADDYLVFPALSLKAGKVYKIAYDARPYNNPSKVFPERAELVVGTEPEAESLTTVLIPPTDLKEKGWRQMVCKEFQAEADGNYYFAVHCISDADQAWLLIDNFSVKEINVNGPESVANLKAVADPDGYNKATISFTMPVKTNKGDDLSGELNVKIYRNDLLVMNEQREAGEEVAFIDQTPLPGNYTYSVVVSKGDDKGDDAEVKVYVGVAIPDVVTNCKAIDRDNKVDISWTAPKTGAGGGKIFVEDLKYNLYPASVNHTGWIIPDYENPYATNLTDTKHTLAMPTDQGEQKYEYIAITAKNDAGESADREAYVLVGAPYSMPMIESSAGGTIANWWGVELSESIISTGGTAGDGEPADAYDGDNGCMVMNATSQGWIEIASGKIAFGSAQKPFLYTHVKSNKAARLSVSVMTLEKTVKLQTLNINSTSYTEYKFDLSGFAGEKWIRVIFTGDFDKATKLNIDKTIVAEFCGNDLEASISAPAAVTTGQTATAIATVKNLGEKRAEGYKVKVYADDRLLAAFEGNEAPALEMFASQTYAVDFATSVFDEAKDVALKVVVDYADENPGNNTASASISVQLPDVDPVDEVNAERTAAGASISWTIAAKEPIEVNEDFEGYDDSLAANGDKIGEWTAYDVDGLPTYAPDASSWYHGEPYAFTVWTPSSYLDNDYYNLGYFCRSGKKAVMFPDNVPSQLKPGNDDWLVSPVLPGTAQTVKFYVNTDYDHIYGPEKFEVCYSSANTLPSSMTKLYESEAEPGEWTEVRVDLPEGAKHFAIHFVAQNAFLLCVDDISFKANANPTAFAIYLDGAKIGEVDGSARSFDYEGPLSQGSHTASVSAIYSSKESAPVSSVIAPAGIDGIRDDITISAARGAIIISGAKHSAVYGIDGRCHSQVAGDAVIQVEPGFYIVTADGKTAKLTVR